VPQRASPTESCRSCRTLGPGAVGSLCSGRGEEAVAVVALSAFVAAAARSARAVRPSAASSPASAFGSVLGRRGAVAFEFNWSSVMRGLVLSPSLRRVCTLVLGVLQRHGGSLKGRALGAFGAGSPSLGVVPALAGGAHFICCGQLRSSLCRRPTPPSSGQPTAAAHVER